MMKRGLTIAILAILTGLNAASATETVFSETFDLVSTGGLPAGWVVSTNASTSVTVSEIPDASDKSLLLVDADASESVEAWVNFSSQQGPVVASWAFMETGGTTAGEGHHMALLANDQHAVELFTIDGNLVCRDLDGTDHVLQAISKDTWYDITLVADPTHFAADVYVDDVLKLQGASFQHTTTRLTGILFGSSDSWADDSLYVNDITVSKADLVLDENFDAMTTDAEPVDWQVTTNTGTAIAISETPSSTNKSMRVTDASASGFSEVWKSFDQMDRPFTASWNFMVTGNEEGHRMQLLSGTNVVFELATDSAGILRYTRPSSAGYDMGVPAPNVWHQIDVTLNLAARKADVYLDGVLKWSHRELLNTSVSYIDRVLFGSSDVTEQYDLYVDDVTIDAGATYTITPLDVSTPRVPIVLKLDDLSGYSLWWQRATDFIADRQLSVSPGIFGNTLGGASGTYLSYLQSLNSDPSVEIFLHTYDHIDPEFQGTDYTYQKNHIEWTQAAAESTLGSRLTVFGASFNKTDTNTVQVLSEDSDIQIWLFCDQDDTAGKTPLYRVAGVNIEESTFIPDPEAFVTGYKANVDANDYFVIQGHPNNWTDARWYNFVRLIDYLEDNELPTMTPTALVSMLSGPDTNAPAAPAGVAAVAGDNTVFLDWDDNSESDLDSYTVYRSTTSGTNYSVIASNLTVSASEDSSAVNGSTYYYVVTATDTSTNESPTSAEVSATPAVDSTAPAAPTGLAAAAGNSAVSLNWDDNAEPDLASYTVYRSTTSSSGYGVIASNLIVSAYGDSTAANDVTYYYVVTATDVSGNESATSTEVSALPQANTVGYWRFEGGSAGTEIATAASEFNSPSMDGEQWSSNATNVLYSSDVAGAYVYDPLTLQYRSNTGSMLAPGTAGSDNSQILVNDMSVLDGSWTLEMFVKVEEDGGAVSWPASAYNRLFNLDGSATCNGSVGSTSGGSTLLQFRIGSSVYDYSSNFEDGAWHHLAYVANYDGTNTAFKLYRDSIEVISSTYAGKFTSQSYQDLRFGISSAYSVANIDWFIDDVRLSDGALSTNQFLQIADEDPNAGSDTTPPAVPAGLAATAGESIVSLDWDDNVESDLAGYTVYRSTVSGSGYSIIASNLTASTYDDSSAVNDTTYYYVVTATDTSTNESATSTQVSATPVAVTVSTIGYWRFEGGAAGAEIVSAASEVNSPSMDGEQWSSNGTNVLYSSDVAGAYIYDPMTSQTNSNTGSMHAPATASAENSQILVNDMSVLDGSWTLEMFVKVEESGGAVDWVASAYNRLFNLDGNTSCNGAVGASSGGTTLLQFRLGSTIYDYSSNFEDGEWHHLAYVVSYDGTNTATELFRDYASVGTGSYAGKFTSQSYQDLRFGISSSANVPNLDWFLDDVRLSDNALATNQFLRVTDEGPVVTPPEAAGSPLPANAASDVSVDANLSWTAGNGAVSHDVYFGTDSLFTGADLQASQTNTTFDPGTLSTNTTYYWRIDEVNAVGTTTGSVWSFTTRADVIVDVPAVSNVTHILFFGASITDGIADHQASTIEEEFLQTYGLNVTVTNYAEGGRGVVPALAAWEAMKANWTGTNALVVIHTLGNDVSDYRPWSTLDQTTKDELYDATSNLVASIKANGNIPLLVNTTFRNYDGTTINNEDAGSKPFNDNIIDPIAATLDPVMYTNGAPYIDPYDFTRNRNTAFQNSDGIHYTQQGYGILRRFWVENIARRILGQAPYTEARIENPGSPSTSPQKSLIHFNSMDTGDSWYIFGAHQFAGSQTTLDQGLTPLEGYAVNSIRASLDSGPVSANHNSNALDTGDTSKTLANDTVKNYSVRTASNTWVTAMTFSGFDAGQAVDISIAAYKNAYGTGSIGEYTTDGGTNTVTIDASLENSGSHIVTIPSEADNNGTITLEFRAQAGSDYAYLNGILLEPVTTEAPEAAGLPSPADSVINVSTDATLSWTAGSNAVSHNVYFGTNSPLTEADLQASLTNTVYDPGVLSKGTTHYWRVDEVNDAGTTEGTEWSFSTVTNYAVADVTHVIFFGASITEGIALNGTVDNMIAQEFSDTYGLDLVVTNFTQGGREVAEGLAAWEVAKTNWTGTKALVVIHPIANNMLHNGVWSELDQATKDEFFNDTSNLVESVKNNGNIPMLINTAFVNYSGETLSYDTSVLTNEVLGTLPYNENIIDVIAPTLDPVMVTNGTTFLEMYNFTRNRNTSIQTTDGIHYTQQGYSILRRYWVENIARRILGQAPYQESRVEDPSSPTSSVQPSLIHFTTFEGSGYSWNVFGAHQFMTSKAMTDEGLTPLEGYEANSVLASFDPTPVQGGHNSKAFDTGDTTATLANDTVKNYYIRTTSNSWVTAMAFSGFDPGQSVDISITAYKNAYGTGSIGEYTTDGGTTVEILDASLDNTGSHTLTLPSTADGSGEIVLEFRAQDGSGYGYLSGILLEPQAAQADSPTVIASMFGSSFILSWEGGGSYTVLTNADLTNPNGWGALTSGTSPITNAIGSESQLFYRLSE